MPPEEKTNDSSEKILRRHSKTRQEIEAELARMGISLESRITIINLDSGDRHYFDDYPQAMEFMKGKRGRWYMATPGIRGK